MGRMVAKNNKKGDDDLDPDVSEAVVDTGEVEEEDTESEWADGGGDKDEVEDF